MKSVYLVSCDVSCNVCMSCKSCMQGETNSLGRKRLNMQRIKRILWEIIYGKEQKTLFQGIMMHDLHLFFSFFLQIC